MGDANVHKGELTGVISNDVVVTYSWFGAVWGKKFLTVEKFVMFKP